MFVRFSEKQFQEGLENCLNDSDPLVRALADDLIRMLDGTDEGNRTGQNRAVNPADSVVTYINIERGGIGYRRRSDARPSVLCALVRDLDFSHGGTKARSQCTVAAAVRFTGRESRLPSVV